jgi:hypothetical protein
MHLPPPLAAMRAASVPPPSRTGTQHEEARCMRTHRFVPTALALGGTHNPCTRLSASALAPRNHKKTAGPKPKPTSDSTPGGAGAISRGATYTPRSTDLLVRVQRVLLAKLIPDAGRHARCPHGSQNGIGRWPSSRQQHRCRLTGRGDAKLSHVLQARVPAAPEP